MANAMRKQHWKPNKQHSDRMWPICLQWNFISCCLEWWSCWQTWHSWGYFSFLAAEMPRNCRTYRKSKL